MFEFSKLNVYVEAKSLYNILSDILETNPKTDLFLKDQTRLSSLTIVTNIAEGNGKYTKADKRHHYIQAKTSVYKTVALTNLLLDQKSIKEKQLQEIEEKYMQIVKMLSGLIKSTFDNENKDIKIKTKLNDLTVKL